MIDTIPSGSLRLTARHPGYGTAHRRVTLPVREVVLTLQTPGTIEGVLTEGGGPPAPGKWIVVVDPARMGHAAAITGMPRIVAPDAKGAFCITGVEPGQRRLSASPSVGGVTSLGAAFRLAQESRFFGTGGSTSVVVQPGRVARVHLEANEEPSSPDVASVQVTGTVTVNGRPGAGLVVTGWSGRRLVARVDAQGRFDLHRVAVGAIYLQVEDPGHDASMFGGDTLWARRVQLRRDADVDLAIDVQTGSLDGIVVGPASAPVPGCTVFLQGVAVSGRARTDARLMQMADDRGAFRFARVPAGTYTVRVRSPDHGRGSVASVVVQTGIATSGVRVRLQVTASVSGSVDLTILGGHKTRWMWISLVPEGKPTGDDAPSAQVHAAGKFTVTGVVPGSYRARMWAQLAERKVTQELEGVDPILVGSESLRGILVRLRRKPPKPPKPPKPTATKKIEKKKG